jgi:hypothetical protein
VPVRRKSRRGRIALGVLVLWIGALALLARRELFRPKGERLAEAALRINPGAVYFAVMRAGEQIGFASSTIDTTAQQITATDYLVADLPMGGEEKRAETRSVVTMSRALRVDSFTVSFETDSIPFTASGRMSGDTTLVLALGDTTDADTARIAIAEPVMLPTLVPLAVILGDVPKVGGKTTLSVFDPVEQAPKTVVVEILAESVFVVSDSARLDSAARRWVVAHDDTVRAWRIRTDGTPAFTGWVDEQGRLVQADVPGGLSIERRAYEISFENWKLDARARGTRVTADRDILETTAIASNRMVHVNRLQQLKVRLRGTSLAGFVLDGGRQHMAGDTMIVRREGESAFVGVRPHRDPRQYSDSVRQYLRIEPLLPRTPEIAAAARRIVGTQSDPVQQVRLLNTWVHDSLAKRTSIGVPNAQTVLRTRSGDCNEHAQLFTALARFLGIPTRVAAGLAYVDGKFYYHAWPEVYLTDWVAVDPTFGQVPADAGHLRFTVGGLGRQADLLRLIGTLKIDVVSAR